VVPLAGLASLEPQKIKTRKKYRRTFCDKGRADNQVVALL